MSDTPRTDEELKRITSMCDGDSDDTCYVMDQLGKHARELERELTAAKDELSKKIGELAAMQKQRDEARIRVCEFCARMGGVYRRINREVVECKTPEEIAEVCGWDCFAKKEGGGA